MTEQVTLALTRGLPASGKTTRARAWVAESPGRARVNRDDLRDMCFGGWTGDQAHEDAVTAAQHAAVDALLRAGISVVVDDTNLYDTVAVTLAEIGLAVDARVEVWDLRDVPVQVCVARDADRAERGERAVGPQVIWDKAARYLGAGAP